MSFVVNVKIRYIIKHQRTFVAFVHNDSDFDGCVHVSFAVTLQTWYILEFLGAFPTLHR